MDLQLYPHMIDITQRVLVQEAACLIMGQLYLTESKHGAKGSQQEPNWRIPKGSRGRWVKLETSHDWLGKS